MSVLFEPLRPLPTDNVLTPTSVEQDEVEQDIVELLDAYQQRGRESAATKSTAQQEGYSAVNGDSATTSSASRANTALLRSLIDSEVPLTPLDHKRHRAFLQRIYAKPLPSGFLAFDPSRCWLIFWSAQAHALLGDRLDERLRTRAISTLLRFQNDSTRSDKSSIGGFGSGHGQISHLMGTYATVMALAILGGPGAAPSDDDVALGVSISIGKGGWDAIDRPKLYAFMLSLKQPDGSFTVHTDGEIDVRSIYCVLCISLMLGIATPELLEGVGDAIANCQTYEGGLSAASHPFASTSSQGGAALGEAHGGYVYCAMAAHLCLALLPSTKKPSSVPFSANGSATTTSSQQPGSSSVHWDEDNAASSSRLDLDDVVRWAASQQGVPIEGGGFRGRTNKLVDGCYGWFSGAGLGTVLGALTELKYGQWWKETDEHAAGPSTSPSDGRSDGWESVDESTQLDGYLFDRRALQEYILEVAQEITMGGLRDKPGKRADAYHTCYNLSGLSLCQYRVHLDGITRQAAWDAWRSTALPSNDANVHSKHARAQLDDTWRRACYVSMLGWTIDPKQVVVLGPPSNRLNITHPVFNVPFTSTKRVMDWAYGQDVSL